MFVGIMCVSAVKLFLFGGATDNRQCSEILHQELFGMAYAIRNTSSDDDFSSFFKDLKR